MIAKEIQLNGEWLSVYSELNIENVYDVFIQNKSTGSIRIWPKSSLPTKNSEGIYLKIGDTTTVSATNEDLYVRGSGSIFTCVITNPSVTLVLPEEAFNINVGASVAISNAEQDPVPSKIHTFTSINNSTTANLNANQVYIGTADDVSDYGTIQVSLASDKDSALNGLIFQTSPDMLTWYDMELYTYNAAGVSTYSMAPSAKYFRLKYVNTGAATTKFFIQTFYKQGYVKPSSHRTADNINGENDAELVKAVLAAEMQNGMYTNINATNEGNLRVSIQEFEQGINILQVEHYGAPTISHNLVLNSTSKNTILNPTTRRLSIYARTGAIRFRIGTTAQIALNDTDHFISKDERMTISVPLNCNIAIIKDSEEGGSGTSKVELTELGL
jgi:hypothetical protein